MDTLKIEHLDELQRLREGVARTGGLYAQAQREYNLALSAATDLGLSSDASEALKFATSRYDIALSDYNAAVQRLTDYYLKRY